MQQQSAGLSSGLLHSLRLSEPESVPSMYPEGTPRRVRRQRAVQEASQQAPAELLGLAVRSTGTPNAESSPSLEAEFERYLKDTSGTDCVDILTFWQVRFSSNFLHFWQGS